MKTTIIGIILMGISWLPMHLSTSAPRNSAEELWFMTVSIGLFFWGLVRVLGK